MVRRIAWVTLDDTFGTWWWLANHPTAASIWQAPPLAWMKAQYDAYGACFLCPCFGGDISGLWSTPHKSLANVAANSAWQAEFAAASSWLRFSFHSASYIQTYFQDGALFNGTRKPEQFDTATALAADYASMRAQIVRICGEASWCDTAQNCHYLGANAAGVATIRAAHSGAFSITYDWNPSYYPLTNYSEWFLANSGADAGYRTELEASTHRLMSDGTLMLHETVYPEANSIEYTAGSGVQDTGTAHSFAEYVATLDANHLAYMHLISHESQVARTTFSTPHLYPLVKTWLEDGIAWIAANGYEWKHPEVGDFDTPTTLTATAAGDHIALRFPPTVGTQYVEGRVI